MTEEQQSQPPYGDQYENASKGPLEENAEGPLDEGNPPGRSDTGSTHPEANPTGNIGIADYGTDADHS